MKKFAKNSLIFAIIGAVLAFTSTLMKLNRFDNTKVIMYCAVISAVISTLFYFISIFKEYKRDYFFWVLLGLIFPGLSQIVYWTRIKNT